MTDTEEEKVAGMCQVGYLVGIVVGVCPLQSQSLWNRNCHLVNDTSYGKWWTYYPLRVFFHVLDDGDSQCMLANFSTKEFSFSRSATKCIQTASRSRVFASKMIHFSVSYNCRTQEGMSLKHNVVAGHFSASTVLKAWSRRCPFVTNIQILAATMCLGCFSLPSWI